MATELKGIERSRALSQMLKALERAKASDGLQKAQFVKEILDLRERLFPGENHEEDVIGRIKANPIDMSSTLETQEYAEIMHTWLPNSTVVFDGVEAENAKGFAIALSNVLTTYPQLANSGLLKFVSSGRGVNRLRRKCEKEAKSEVDKLYENFTKTDAYKNWIDAFNEAFDRNIKTAEYMTQWYGERKALKFAEWFDVSTNTNVRRLLASKPDLDETFIAACKTAYAQRLSRNEFERVLKKEHPGIFKADIPRFTGANGKLRYATYYYGYGVIVSDQFKENITKKINRDISFKWQPKGTGGDSPETGAKSVVTHELGHAMDDLLGLSKSLEILRIWRSYRKSQIAEELSEYAATKVQEMIAEAFCEYHTSSKPRPLAVRIGSIIDQAYARKFGGGQ